MKFIRKILFCSLDHEWIQSIHDGLSKVPKIKSFLASTRSESSHLLSEHNFEMIVFEDSFTPKNIELTLRAVQGLQKNAPPFVVFFSYDLFSILQLDLPSDLNITYLYYSLPLLKEEALSILQRRLFPGLGSRGNLNFDLEFVEMLIQSTKTAIDTILVDANLIINSPVKMEDTSDLDIKIRGKIMMKNEFFSGSFFVSFPEKTYLQLRKNVLGETEETVDDSNSDFAGELANIIYGQTKKELHENGVNLEMVIPTWDRTHGIKSKGHPIIVIPIDSSVGRFYIKLAKDVY